jgi:SAM-dependent methyltransferase
MHEPAESPPVAPVTFWEERYAGADSVWSGRPNPALVAAAVDLRPGTALELGCGEGADAIWLAEQGWQVTGIDISSTAIQRAERAATHAGLGPERVRFLATDLSSWSDGASVDLVTASFFHSPVELPRSEILQHASRIVAPGGHLLVISHAALPPWSQSADRHEHQFLSPSEELAALELGEGWDVLVCETRPRDAVGPHGEHAPMTDVVVLVRRR